MKTLALIVIGGYCAIGVLYGIWECWEWAELRKHLKSVAKSIGDALFVIWVWIAIWPIILIEDLQMKWSEWKAGKP